ncbi:hypothetical protein V1508DRAFT_442752 [Lipomyces doorenjongii]|uniref:uncharacterized protein n=1 Tax=Lipomyces doorenjongii TaxID=383834 RepID=UPI0034CE13A9
MVERHQRRMAHAVSDKVFVNDESNIEHARYAEYERRAAMGGIHVACARKVMKIVFIGKHRVYVVHSVIIPNYNIEGKSKTDIAICTEKSTPRFTKHSPTSADINQALNGHGLNWSWVTEQLGPWRKYTAKTYFSDREASVMGSVMGDVRPCADAAETIFFDLFAGKSATTCIGFGGTNWSFGGDGSTRELDTASRRLCTERKFLVSGNVVAED